MVKINLDIKVPLIVFKEEGAFVAYTPVLDLSTCADTFDQVKKRFAESVNIFFKELVERNTLDQVLLELGWRKLRQQWRPPVMIAHEAETIRVKALA